MCIHSIRYWLPYDNSPVNFTKSVSYWESHAIENCTGAVYLRLVKRAIFLADLRPFGKFA